MRSHFPWCVEVGEDLLHFHVAEIVDQTLLAEFFQILRLHVNEVGRLVLEAMHVLELLPGHHVFHLHFVDDVFEFSSTPAVATHLIHLSDVPALAHALPLGGDQQLPTQSVQPGYVSMDQTCFDRVNFFLAVLLLRMQVADKTFGQARPGTGIVDDRTPNLPSLPHAVVGLVVLEAHKERNGNTDDRNRPPGDSQPVDWSKNIKCSGAATPYEEPQHVEPREGEYIPEAKSLFYKHRELRITDY